MTLLHHNFDIHQSTLYVTDCEKHGWVRTIGQMDVYDIGRCPKCFKENPSTRFSYPLTPIPDPVPDYIMQEIDDDAQIS